MKSAHDKDEAIDGKIEIDMVRALYASGLDHNAHRSVVHFVNSQVGYEMHERLEHILNQVIFVAHNGSDSMNSGDGLYRIGVKS